ncbi:DUF2852 domain-containing protein [Flavimaricola marinus]|uniref:DUF2852 domain-containing protein n=1 Tax=Flavimaricola marinus TaxID=1819565 RepID=A0A238LIY5_9RHOB|nr:DUF2852 domain-containing protein [Flavimaricola marinus]SMY09677.1 hypothetical protein LOM8899_03849 [Flavimaricola marinus]
MLSSAPTAHSAPVMTDRATPPMALLVLSTVLFAVFSFVVTIVAMATFWPAGVLLALVLGWRGGFIPSFGHSAEASRMAQSVRPDLAEPTLPSSGNASFDAYRTDMLNRLHKEQEKFEGFLVRLREAKDKSEFDTFMDERAKRTQIPAE